MQEPRRPPPAELRDERSRSIAFDRAAEYYDATRGYPPGVAEHVAELFCQAGKLGPSSTVLEIGIGTGRIALPLATRVRRVIGVDLARPMLARLCAKRTTEPVVPLLADALALPFADARFDAVIAVHVFHLVPAWRRVLAEVRRVLAPGGYFLDGGDSRELTELWDAANEGIPRLENVGVKYGDRDFPLEAGFVRDATLAFRYREQLSFLSFIDQLERRVWSRCWSLGDDDHARLCANMRAAIVARYGRIDAELDLEREVSVRAFRRA